MRALDTALFMLSAPALAGLLAARRARYASPSVAPTIPLPVELLLWSSASIAMLTLSSTALLVAGAWSVHAMVWLVTTETVVLALWPVASSGKRVRSG